MLYLHATNLVDEVYYMTNLDTRVDMDLRSGLHSFIWGLEENLFSCLFWCLEAVFRL